MSVSEVESNNNGTKITEKKSVAFIGSCGVPNRYGGFESFLESVTPVMVSNGHNVIVTCDAGKYEDHSPEFKGVKREFIGVKANGPLSTIHDMVAYLRVFRKVDSVVVLGVSAGPLFLLMRLISMLFGKKLVVNVDGIEWRRTKFSKPVRALLWLYDACAQLSANTIIYDSTELLPFVHKPFRHKGVFAAYSGDHVLRFPDEPKTASALTICRIEPENNIELLIEGVLRSDIEEYVLIGNWGNSEYGRAVKEKYQHHDKLKLTDPVYDPVAVGRQRERCAIYLHGHSVGGTNPSLVEMFFYDCALLCFDCSFNRSAAAEDADYFDGVDSLAEKINQLLLNTGVRDSVVRDKYTATAISDRYLAVL